MCDDRNCMMLSVVAFDGILLLLIVVLEDEYILLQGRNAVIILLCNKRVTEIFSQNSLSESIPHMQLFRIYFN